MKLPKYSPWGPIQHSTILGEGIVSVMTARHGGIKLDRKRNAQVPQEHRSAGGWYEEDCDWSIVALVFPEAFDAKALECAHKTAKNWRPFAYEKITGEKASLAESHVLRAHKHKHDNSDKFVTRTAWGSGGPFNRADIPEGFVGIYAVRASDDREAWLLVSRDEYKNSEFGYIAKGNEKKWHKVA